MEVDPALSCRSTATSAAPIIAGIELGGLYAYAGREWVVERVRQIIGAAVTDRVHNHHNFAWREKHGGRDYWVVRKGATPAFPGQRGFVGGSMGDNAVILWRRRERGQSADSLYSTVHGAGRIMSRTEARGRFVSRTSTARKSASRASIRHDEWQAWMRERGRARSAAAISMRPRKRIAVLRRCWSIIRTR
jgi:tRNA-splicing ligase RtcB